jgi:hypothetical protein
MSAKDRAIRKSLRRSDLESFVADNGLLDPIQLRRLKRWDVLDSLRSELAPADINELWEYANEQLKHLDPKQTLDGVLVGEDDPIIQELFEARRGIYLAQVELFKLLDNPSEVKSRVGEIRLQIVEHYATLKRLRNTKT